MPELEVLRPGAAEPDPADSKEAFGLAPMVAKDTVNAKSKIAPFDNYDVVSRCNEISRRISMLNSTDSPPWKWDILELLEDSRDVLFDAQRANSSAENGLWRDIGSAFEGENKDASTLPVGLRKQCEELLARREMWFGDFDTELRAILARGREIRERLLFEDVDRAGWFSASGVSPLEVQRLLERHLDMHQRATRLARQLKLVCRSLQQQGAVSSRRRAFQLKSMGEKLQSSLVCLAAVAVAPVPGSSEMWFATTTMMWLDKDQAGQHVVYEHPRDTDPATVLTQFHCHSTKAHRALAAWFDMPPEKRRNCVLIHNASVRRVIVKSLIVNCIDGYGGSTLDWTSALDNHPLGSVMKKAMAMGSSSTGNKDEDKVVIGAQRLALIRLPTKPDTNWGWRGLFSYGDVKVGECALREDGIFSFICADCGLRVGDREGDLRAEQRLVGADDQLKRTASANRELAAEDDAFPKPPLRRPTFITDVKESKVVEDPKLGSEPKADVEVINSTEEPVQVKIFELGAAGSHSSRFFRSALAEATISGGQGRIFMVKATPGPNSEEAAFEVEIRIGSKKAKCEVVGGQVIFVDGLVD